jgi:hypothetical protein
MTYSEERVVHAEERNLRFWHATWYLP